MFGPWVLNEIWITNLSSALIGMLMSSSKLFLFSKEVHFISGVRLTLELYCAVVIKYIAFLTILAKLTVVFTCTSLPLNVTPLFSDVVVVSDLNKNFAGSTDLAKKRHGSADLHTPIHPPHKRCQRRIYKRSDQLHDYKQEWD